MLSFLLFLTVKVAVHVPVKVAVPKPYAVPVKQPYPGRSSRKQ